MTAEMHIEIKRNQLDDAIRISKHIPEFSDPYDKEEYLKRISDNQHLILVAYHDDIPVGFKIGYEISKGDCFYSWMGGILPSHRRKGVAEKLANYQEQWAAGQKYKRIRIKTREKHKAMITFCLNRNFLTVDHIWQEK
ncbi:MAG: GNAT family N-acetyltransferase, partial [Candidatus Neomarinimicrobiota bacterium]